METPKTIKGIRDIIYPESVKWKSIIDTTERIFESYGYRNIFLPVIEYTDLFLRSIGEDTDIVSKEMYSFKDRKGRNLSLRPEGTVGVVRAMIQNKLLQGNIREKVYYFGPMFRYERPQAGRYRQFYQIGCEVYGSNDSSQDAEMAELAVRIARQCRVEEITLKVSSVGCETCRKEFREKLKDILSDKSEELCADCNRRLETNTLRVLDCKNKTCQDLYEKLIGMGMVSENKLKPLTDNLCSECAEYYGFYKFDLKARNIKYTEDNRLVRGLDYYTGPVFELESAGMTIIAGGRYDNLVKDLGGPDVPACGWALGLERLVSVSNLDFTEKSVPEVSIIMLVDGSERNENLDKITKIAEALREKNISVEEDYERTVPGKRFKIADKKNIKNVIIFGTDEAKNNTVSIKDMKTGDQTTVSIEDVNEIIKRIKC